MTALRHVTCHVTFEHSREHVTVVITNYNVNKRRLVVSCS